MKWVMDKARQMRRRECQKVTLCAMPGAINFYLRLKFTPLDINEEEEEGETASASSSRMPGAIWMVYKCGRSVQKPAKR